MGCTWRNVLSLFYQRALYFGSPSVVTNISSFIDTPKCFVNNDINMPIVCQVQELQNLARFFKNTALWFTNNTKYHWMLRKHVKSDKSLTKYDGYIKLRLSQTMRDQSICSWSFHAWKTLDYSMQVDPSAMRPTIVDMLCESAHQFSCRCRVLCTTE